MGGRELVGVIVFIFFIIVQRVWELKIAKRNERKIKQLGGIEVGENHYFLFILLHVAFFVSLFVESTIFHTHLLMSEGIIIWLIFICTQIFRVWCIHSLGIYWNTKIIIVPNHKRITKGPYQFVNHPNYIIVAIELCVIPILIGAFMTAFIFPLLHLLLLCIRIPVENNALKRLNL